jgi:Family of unknown function (DUF6220)
MATAPPAPARRSLGRQVRLILMGLFVLGIVVQFYLAGRGVFGAGSYEAHKSLGWALHSASLAIFILTIAFPDTRNRTDVGLAFALFVLVTIQTSIASFKHPEVGALHPVNALLVTGAAAGILSRDRRLGRAAPRPATPA